jgi:hypothetical protein
MKLSTVKVGHTIRVKAQSTYEGWGVRWYEFDKNDRKVEKQKFFKTKPMRDKFIEALEKKDNFAGISSYSNVVDAKCVKADYGDVTDYYHPDQFFKVKDAIAKGVEFEKMSEWISDANDKAYKALRAVMKAELAKNKDAKPWLK